MIFDILNTSFQLMLIYTVIIALVAYLKNTRDKKKLMTLGYIKRWNDRAFEEHKIESMRNGDSNYYWSMDDKSQITRIAHLHLNFFEELSLAIQNGQADEKLAKDFFYYTLIAIYRDVEQELPHERLRFSNVLYRNAERLYGRWLNDTASEGK